MLRAPSRPQHLHSFYDLLTAKAKLVYDNVLTIYISSDDKRVRYLQITVSFPRELWGLNSQRAAEDIKRQELATLFNACCELDLLLGVTEQGKELLVSDDDDKLTRKIFYIFPVLKEELAHLTNSELNDKIKIS